MARGWKARRAIAEGLKWGGELEKEMAEMRVRVTGEGRRGDGGLPRLVRESEK
jgi:hypothetical protein